ncbi:MAG TPA: SWIM zinc finger family protein [Symbiobacteriaceae bacterium]|jgi:uncharacterized Zn finger protein
MAKRQSFGTTWWSGRWIAVLESFGWANRLQRGRTYARTGHVRELQVAAGKVTAHVQGSRPQPYRVTIQVAPLSQREWNEVTAAMAAQAAFAAQLLSGVLPAEAEAVFAAAQVPLLPRTARDVTTKCNCPDWANPCKHVAAVFYQLATAFDADPFLLLQFRGRDREMVLGELRAHRAAAALPVPEAEPGALLGDLAQFWRVAAPAPHIDLQVHGMSGGLPRQFGAPPGLTGPLTAQLAAYYHTVSQRAAAYANARPDAGPGRNRDAARTPVPTGDTPLN